MSKVDEHISSKTASAMQVVRTLLRREKKMSVKSYLMPFAVVGPIDENEKMDLVSHLQSFGYTITIEGDTFSHMSHMLIDWTNK